MSALRWFAACNEILAKIAETQLPALRRAAELMAACGAQGGAVHFHDTGHCTREPIHRAGGLCLLKPFQFSLTVDHAPGPLRGDAAAQRVAAQQTESDERLAAVAVARSGFVQGEVLILSSVSGKAASVVEVALAAQRLGVKVIAITNVTYSRAVTSQHSSGRRLCEVADVVIDNCGVIGDAVLEVEGVGTKVAPTSGVAFCYIIWALVAEAVAQMQAGGLTPHVYRSVNLPDGEEFNARAKAAYRETGV